MRNIGTHKSYRGAAIGGICAVVTFAILALFRDNLGLGTTVAGLVMIALYYFLGRLLLA